MKSALKRIQNNIGRLDFSARSQTNLPFVFWLLRKAHDMTQPMRLTRLQAEEKRSSKGKASAYLSKSMEKKWLKMKTPEFRHAVVEAEIVNGIAAQIRTIRQQRGWSQKKLAELLDTTQAAISRLEDPSYGRYSVQTLLAIGRAFDVAMHLKFVPFTQFLVQTTCNAKRECLEAENFETEDLGIQYYVSQKNTATIVNIAPPNGLKMSILKKQFSSHQQGSTIIFSPIQSSRTMDFFIPQKAPCINEYGYEIE